MAKRKNRDKISISEDDMLKPIDIEKFGSDNDPCFGKLYNLNEPECKRCGDSEICGAIFSQLLNKKRKKIEKNDRFKDMEISHSVKDMVNFINKLKSRNKKRSFIILKTKKKFKVNRDEILKYL